MLSSGMGAPMASLARPRLPARLCRWFSLCTATLPHFHVTGCRVRSILVAGEAGVVLRRLIHSSSMWRTRPDTLEESIFNILKHRHHNTVSVTQLLATIESSGIKLNDARMSDFMARLKEKKLQIIDLGDSHEYSMPLDLDHDTFIKCVSPSIGLLNRVLLHDFVIPEWKEFTGHLREIYNICRPIDDGSVATYIPNLARTDPKLWGVSVCSTDGQRFSIGDTDKRFCLQSAQFPLAYALALNRHSRQMVHSYVGHEPSGLPHGNIALNNEKKPHNPLIVPGAIVISSLLNGNADCLADRFDYVISQYKDLAGGEYVGFDNSTFLAERENNNRNNAIGYILKEHKCFAKDVNLQEEMDFYFQLCSIQTDCNAGSVIAATLANGGICPTTGKRLLNAESVRDTLSLMHSCGMYDYSGQFAFRVGLPAKSSVAGVIMVVVPHALGLCLYSPPLDHTGNAVRGIRFCQELVSKFNFSNYDSLQFLQKKQDPRRKAYDFTTRDVISVLYSAFHNDVTALRREFLRGIDMAQQDYDGRTALHIAAAEGHAESVRFLVDICRVPRNPKDRWGFTPEVEARRGGYEAIAHFLAS